MGEIIEVQDADFLEKFNRIDEEWFRIADEAEPVEELSNQSKRGSVTMGQSNMASEDTLRLTSSFQGWWQILIGIALFLAGIGIGRLSFFQGSKEKPAVKASSVSEMAPKQKAEKPVVAPQKTETPAPSASATPAITKNTPAPLAAAKDEAKAATVVKADTTTAKATAPASIVSAAKAATDGLAVKKESAIKTVKPDTKPLWAASLSHYSRHSRSKSKVERKQTADATLLPALDANEVLEPADFRKQHGRSGGNNPAKLRSIQSLLETETFTRAIAAAEKGPRCGEPDQLGEYGRGTHCRVWRLQLWARQQQPPQRLRVDGGIGPQTHRLMQEMLNGLAAASQ